MVVRLFLAMPRGCLWSVIVVFPDHTYLLFLLWEEFMMSLSGDKQADIIDAFKTTSRYLNDILNIKSV